MRWRPVGVVAVSVVATSALLAGCGAADNSKPRPVDSDIAALLTPVPTPTPSQSPERQVRQTLLTWVRNDMLIQVPRSLPAKTRQDQLDNALLELVVAGPTHAEASRGLQSKIPPGLQVDGTVRRSRVVLDIPKDSPSEPGGVELSVGQLATTALSIPHVRTVVFTVDGARTAVPTPNGKPKQVLKMRDYRGVLKS